MRGGRGGRGRGEDVRREAPLGAGKTQDPPAAAPAPVGDERGRAVHRGDDRARRQDRGGSRGVRRGGADRRPQRRAAAAHRRAAPAVHARRRLPAGPACSTRGWCAVAADLSDHTFTVDRFFWALLVGAGRGRRHGRARGRSSAPTTTTSTPCASRSASRGAPATASVTDVPGIIYLEIDGLARPVLQRADARRARARDGALARRGHAPALRVGDRPLVADRRLPGRAAARLQRRHPRLPLGGEGVGPHHDLLGAGRLRPHRGAALDRPRAAGATAAPAAATCSRATPPR